MPRKRLEVDSQSTPINANHSFMELVKADLAKMVEKVGGSIGTPEELEHLHEPSGHIKTGIYAFDAILSGGNGIPFGRFIEIVAPESVGKSALAEYIMGQVHRQSGLTHYIDTECTLDESHVACYGINENDYLTPDLPDLESVWDYARGVVRMLDAQNKKHEKNKEPLEPVNLIILDSLAATPARAERTEKSHSDSHVGQQARANAKGVRTAVRPFSRASAIFLFINQLRDKIGAFGHGPKTESPGGRALRYAYAIRIKLARIKTIKVRDTAVGHLIEVTTFKNKHAPPFMKCIIALSYKRGIDANWSNFHWFQENGYIVAAGSKGFRWKDAGDDVFKRSNFGEWAEKHRKTVSAAAKAITTAMLERAQAHTGDSDNADNDEDEAE